MSVVFIPLFCNILQILSFTESYLVSAFVISAADCHEPAARLLNIKSRKTNQACASVLPILVGFTLTGRVDWTGFLIMSFSFSFLLPHILSLLRIICF